MLFIRYNNRLINVLHIKQAIKNDNVITLKMSENMEERLSFETPELAETFRRKLESIQIAYNPLDVMAKQHAGGRGKERG